MILDIERYPEFVPWCINGKIINFIDKGEVVEITATLTIGKSFFNKTYKSFVIYDKLLDTIQVTNIGGPLKHLNNKWVFKEVKKGCEVEFYINFELKNKALNLLMLKSFNLGLKKIVDAFSQRASTLFKET